MRAGMQIPAGIQSSPPRNRENAGSTVTRTRRSRNTDPVPQPSGQGDWRRSRSRFSIPAWSPGRRKSSNGSWIAERGCQASRARGTRTRLKSSRRRARLLPRRNKTREIAARTRAGRREHPMPRHVSDARRDTGASMEGSASLTHGVAAELLHKSVSLFFRVINKFELYLFHR